MITFFQRSAAELTRQVFEDRFPLRAGCEYHAELENAGIGTAVMRLWRYNDADKTGFYDRHRSDPRTLLLREWRLNWLGIQIHNTDAAA